MRILSTCCSWLGHTRLAQLLKHGDGAVARLQCPSRFVADWITQHYGQQLVAWLNDHAAGGIRITAIQSFVAEGGRA